MTSSAALPARRRHGGRPARCALAGLVACTVLAPAHALYKVVGPDGSITYTDRPPVAAPNARITPLDRRGAGGPAPATATDAALPPELRQAMQRHPVTLFTTADCRPCESARRYLQQRGVPYTEKRAETEDDAAVLERRVGGRTVPALTIGSQPLRGFAEADWAAYLDAAGYPRESRLPRGWSFPAPTPLVERSAPAPAPVAPVAPEPVAEPAPAPQGEPASPIRF